jgi:CRISPR-associated endonuclease Csn1
LGLKIGTNSIGWCLTENDSKIVDLGVRIFSDGRDPKSGASLAVARRTARLARRRRDRYIARRTAFLNALVRFELMPSDPDEARRLADKDPYMLRHRALDEALHPHETGRALFHLNQRRGFKANRKVGHNGSANEIGKVASGGKALDDAMLEAGARTVGEFLAGNETKRARPSGTEQLYDFFPQRSHVEFEFDAIWAAQAAHDPGQFSDAARAALYRILFFQRPIATEQVGPCAFIASEPRLARAHPLFQKMRLYEAVNQLEIVTPGVGAATLTIEQRDRVITHLRFRREAGFSSLAKVLDLKGGQSFSKIGHTRLIVAGDEVHAAMSDRKRFGSKWGALDLDQQWLLIERILGEEDPDHLQDFLMQEYGLTTEQAASVADVTLPDGYGRFGQTAAALITDEFKKAVSTYEEVVSRLAELDVRFREHNAQEASRLLRRLPYYGEVLPDWLPAGTLQSSDPPEKRWGRMNNPTAHNGLRQVEKLVNGVIAAYGRPEEIVVELAQQLHFSQKDKAQRSKLARDGLKRDDVRLTALRQHGVEDSQENLSILRLWDDLGEDQLEKLCPYCARPITFPMLFNGEAAVSHILPFSKTLDDSLGNKVVSHRACATTKGDRIPYEVWAPDAGRWTKITGQVAKMTPAKQWRFGADAMGYFEAKGGFIDRQLSDRRFLSRLYGRYLSALYLAADTHRVRVITGHLTDRFRQAWKLDGLLPNYSADERRLLSMPKSPSDLRDHAIDAAVVSVTTADLLHAVAKAASQADSAVRSELPERHLPPWSDFAEQLALRLGSVVVSHKADHGNAGKNECSTAARLHNATAYGLTDDVAVDGITPIVVHRVPLASIGPAYVIDRDRIADVTLRDALAAATKGLTGKSFEGAVAVFAREHPIFAGIRRIRIREPLNVIGIRDDNGRIYKAYKGDSNARFDVWRLPDGAWVTTVISTFEAHQKNAPDRRPHPAAKKVLSLRKNDMIAVENSRHEPEYLRVVGFGIDGKITLVCHNEGGTFKKRAAAPAHIDPFRYIYSSAFSLNNSRARQIRITEIGHVSDPGPR